MYFRIPMLLLPALALAACNNQPAPAPAANQPAPAPAHKDHVEVKSEPAPKGHGGHAMEDDDFNWDKVVPPKVHTPLTDLKNDKDPVTLKPAKPDITTDYKGYTVHFESTATRDKFLKKPLKFLNMLSLEPAVDGGVAAVDASTYQDAVTDLCPFMPESEVDPHGTVYILHRGWKFFFCCWTGCGDKFMKNPAAVYDYYGLKEADGKLVRK